MFNRDIKIDNWDIALIKPIAIFTDEEIVIRVEIKTDNAGIEVL